MKIMELMEWGNKKLKEAQETNPDFAKLEAPMLDSELMLAASLGQPKAYLFSNLYHDVPEAKADAFRKMIKRRIKNEPLAYITGRKFFYGRDFSVNRFVLIPRPETESLIESALNTLSELKGETWFADIGVGSGAIAVTIAAETGQPVIANDINERTVTLAKQNARKHKVSDLIEFKTGPGFEPVNKTLVKLQEKDPRLLPDNLIITANLPYLTTEQVTEAQPEVRDWEPLEALVAGADGLDEYWKLYKDLVRAENTLPKNTYTIIEIDPQQSKAIVSLIQHYFPGSKPEIKKDLGGLDRVVISKIK